MEYKNVLDETVEEDLQLVSVKPLQALTGEEQVCINLRYREDGGEHEERYVVPCEPDTAFDEFYRETVEDLGERFQDTLVLYSGFEQPRVRVNRYHPGIGVEL